MKEVIYGNGYARIKEMKVAKVMCEDSLLFFISYFFEKQYGKPFLINWHHEVLCNALERVAKGEILRLIINMPPRHGKTEICVKGFIAWCLSLNNSAKFLHLSYSADLAMDNSNTIKELIQSEDYQELFPIKLKRSKKSKKNWSTENGGGVYSAATGGQVIGFGAGSMDKFDPDASAIGEYISDVTKMKRFAGCIVIDDPIKPEDADSNLKRDRVNMRFDSTIKSRVNSRKTPIILDMQRLHPEDLSGKLIDEGWELLCFPVIIDQRTIETAAHYGVELPQELIGRPMWEDTDEDKLLGIGNRNTLDDWLEVRKINPHVFETQYMQNPQPLEGLIFPRHEMMYFNGKCPEGIGIFYGDPADEGVDKYAMPLAVIASDGFVYIDDVIFSDSNLTMLEPRIVHEITTRNPAIVYIESNNAGALHIRDLKKMVRCKLQGIPHHTQKTMRILAESGFIMTHFKFRNDYKQGSEYEQFIKQIWWALKNGKEKRDDAPDSIAGLSYACRVAYRNLFSPKKLGSMEN